MTGIKEIVYHKDTVEFVTVAVQYCSFIEQSEGMRRDSFIDVALKMLPLLYLKGSLLPSFKEQSDGMIEQFVKEEDYEIIRMTIGAILREKDDYLDVFLSDMVYSDTPIKKSIAEDLADIYQDMKNFVSVYSLGVEETMYEALAVLEDNFSTYWGQTTVNTLRALHEAKYVFKEDDEEIEEGDGF